MKIVVLDGYALNPGDLSWDGLNAIASCEVYDRTEPAEIVSRAADADSVLTNKCPLSAETIAQLPKLRYIGVLATGYNVVDTNAARARGVVVTNVPAYGTRSVAQHVFALILEMTNAAGHHAGTVRTGRWSKSANWSYWDQPLVELEGLILGIIGCGRIGRAVAELGRAFGMTPVASGGHGPDHIKTLSLDALLECSDVVSLHCPLTPETEGLINAKRLRMMKPTAMLINTARGQLVIEADLAAALNRGDIAAAALDVLCVEPPRADNPLLTARNCVITPHIAWAARASRTRLLDIATQNLKAFLEGRPANVV